MEFHEIVERLDECMTREEVIDLLRATATLYYEEGYAADQPPLEDFRLPKPVAIVTVVSTLVID